MNKCALINALNNLDESNINLGKSFPFKAGLFTCTKKERPLKKMNQTDKFHKIFNLPIIDILSPIPSTPNVNNPKVFNLEDPLPSESLPAPGNLFVSESTPEQLTLYSSSSNDEEEEDISNILNAIPPLELSEHSDSENDDAASTL